MKNLILVFVLIALVACKKDKEQPIPKEVVRADIDSVCVQVIPDFISTEDSIYKR